MWFYSCRNELLNHSFDPCSWTVKCDFCTLSTTTAPWACILKTACGAVSWLNKILLYAFLCHYIITMMIIIITTVMFVIITCTTPTPTPTTTTITTTRRIATTTMMMMTTTTITTLPQVSLLLLPVITATRGVPWHDDGECRGTIWAAQGLCVNSSGRAAECSQSPVYQKGNTNVPLASVYVVLIFSFIICCCRQMLYNIKVNILLWTNNCYEFSNFAFFL